MKTIFTILLCFMTATVFSMTIEEEIQQSVVVIPVVEIPVVKIEVIRLEILEIITCSVDNLPLQIISILSYSPQDLALAIQRLTPVELEVFTGRLISPDVLKVVIAKLKTEEINKLAILVYNVSYQARNLREVINNQIKADKFKKYLQAGNLSMCSNLLLKSGVDKKVVDVLIASIGKIPKPVDMPFFECKMNKSQTYKGEANENAFIVGTYQEEVRHGDVVIFDVTSRSNLIKGVKFVEKNKDKIGAVIIGWDSAGRNNYDNMDITSYTEVMKWYSDFYSICKGIKPDLPVGVVVSMTITWREWLDACEFKWDFVALWNVTKFTANFEKIKNTYFRDEQVLICGMNATGIPLKQRYDSDEYRNYIKELKRLGFCGSIYIKTKGGE